MILQNTRLSPVNNRFTFSIKRAKQFEYCLYGTLKEPKNADIGSILNLVFPIYIKGVMSYIEYIGVKESEGFAEGIS